MEYEILVLSLLLTVSFGIGCPENLISTCKCYLLGYDYHVKCNDINSNFELYDILDPLSKISPLHCITIQNSAFNFIPSDVFHGLNFSILTFTESSVMALTDTDAAFVGLEKYLQELQFFNCKFMNSWNFLALRNLKELTTLQIHLGDIEVIEDWDDLKLNKLETISLNQLQLNFISDYAFANFWSLKSLKMTYSKIRTVKRTMLPNPALKLEELKLGFNEIESFPNDMFTDMPQLIYLDIQYNKILYLDEAVFMPVWPILHEFNAEGNEIRCDCRIYWTVIRSLPPTLKAYCGGSLKGRNIGDLIAQDLEDC